MSADGAEKLDDSTMVDSQVEEGSGEEGESFLGWVPRVSRGRMGLVRVSRA